MMPEAKPRLTGDPRPDNSPSSEAASVKPIEMPAPDRGGEPDEECRPCVLRGKGGGEDRRERRHRAVHQPGQPRLNPGQHELAVRAVSSVSRASASRCASAASVGTGAVAGLGPGKIAQKLAGGGVRAALRGLEVEGLGVLLHGGGLVPDAVEAEVFDQPDGAAGVVARDMFAADQRDDLAEAGAVQLDQALAVGVLLAAISSNIAALSG
jgi:hypothetical protein